MFIRLRCIFNSMKKKRSHNVTPLLYSLDLGKTVWVKQPYDGVLRQPDPASQSRTAIQRLVQEQLKYQQYLQRAVRILRHRSLMGHSTVQSQNSPRRKCRLQHKYHYRLGQQHHQHCLRVRHCGVSQLCESEVR
jgi:hypothetical protein